LFGFLQIDSADLFVVLVDQSDGRNSDQFVDAQAFARVALGRLKSSCDDWIS